MWNDLWRMMWMGLLVWTSGCGGVGGPQRYEVEGEVTFQGQAVDRGSIEFSSLAKDTVLTSGAAILEGRYSIPRPQGLTPGEYQVRIYWPEALPLPKDAGSLKQGFPTPKERIPSKYNTQSTLTVKIKPEKNRADFHLK